MGDLLRRTPSPESEGPAEPESERETPSSVIDRYNDEMLEAERFFVLNDLYGTGWSVELRPEHYISSRLEGPSDLRHLRSNGVVNLRGWDFPHVDKNDVFFDGGLQSQTSWESHVEAHRIYNSGLFLWRGRYVEDFEDMTGRIRGENELSFLSTLWSMVEFMLFGARYLHDLIPNEPGSITIQAFGLANRYLVADIPSLHFPTLPITAATKFRRTRTSTGLEWELSWNDVCLDWTYNFLGLFGVEISRPVIRAWQTRLLNRQL